MTKLKKIVGIYKITSPTGKVYIGQSVDIERRWKEHKRSKSYSKLNSSFKSHGIESHIFEEVERCEISELNERERHWQDHYDVLGPNGLNLKLTETDDRSGCVSEETRDRLISHHKNKDDLTEAARREKISDSVKLSITPELKQHWSSVRKNRPVLQEQRDKISKTYHGRTEAEKAETSKRMSLGQLKSKSKRAETIANRTPEESAVIVAKFRETLRLKKIAKQIKLPKDDK